MGKHYGFRIFIRCNIERIIPVRKINPYQSMLSFILQQSIHSRFYMIQNSRLPSILPFNLQIQDRKVSRFFYQLADSPYDPERLIGIPGIIIRIPGQYRMPITELMSQTLYNLFFCFFLSVVQKSDCDLQIIPDSFFPDNTKIHLFFHPVIHHVIDFFIRRFHGQRTIFFQIMRFCFFKFLFHNCRIGLFRYRHCLFK